jgi:hypothetical protein
MIHRSQSATRGGDRDPGLRIEPDFILDQLGREAPSAVRERAKRMCRNIRPLFNFEPPATEDEIRAASLQFVRKISGAISPSKKNEAVFNTAVDDIAKVSARLLASLDTTAAPKNRQDEEVKARNRAAKRLAV